MAGEENLRAFSSEEARKYGAIGGQNRGKSEKRRKSMQETWDIIRKMPLEDGEASEIEKIQNVAQLAGKNVTVEQAIILAMSKKAMKGDVRAFEALRKYTESGRITEDLTRERAELELEKLRMEVEAYHKAAERVDVGVTIVDDIPTS